MKKLFATACITVLLLNVMGYYGVFLGIQYRNEVAMRKVLDSNEYDESQLLTIKIPVSIPYMNDQHDFERVNGNFEHEGEVYRLVKQKYARDTLFIACVVDVEHKRMQEVLEDYVKTFTDKASDQHSKSQGPLNFIKDYLPQSFALHAVTAGWEADVTHNSAPKSLIPAFSASVVHPPERSPMQR